MSDLDLVTETQEYLDGDYCRKCSDLIARLVADLRSTTADLQQLRADRERERAVVEAALKWRERAQLKRAVENYRALQGAGEPGGEG